MQSLLLTFLGYSIIQIMKKNLLKQKLDTLSSKSLILIGVVSFLLSGLVYFISTRSGISSTDQKNCEAAVVQRYGNNSELMNQCASSIGFVVMMKEGDILSAKKAARAKIGSNIIYFLFCCFFLCSGTAFVAKGLKTKNSKPTL